MLNAVHEERKLLFVNGCKCKDQISTMMEFINLCKGISVLGDHVKKNEHTQE
jgi:hypothetical protein